MKQIITILIVCTLLTRCFIGAGTHGKIKEYHFEYSNEELINIVDQFLLDNPKYYEKVDEDFGWIYIRIPPKNDKFGFRIGGNSEIVLIAAGKENEVIKWEKDLDRVEEEKFIENFENNFLDKLGRPKIQKAEIIRDPFVLSFNEDIDTVSWSHYVFKCDTLISYSLPIEFDSLDVDYFKDLVLSFGINSGETIPVVQFDNKFRIDTDYSGYVNDSIYITSYYRLIGQHLQLDPIFNQKSWQNFSSDANTFIRLKEYKRLREDRISEGYEETDVYSTYSEERWMNMNKKLKTGS